jgi:hypothetical protein
MERNAPALPVGFATPAGAAAVAGCRRPEPTEPMLELEGESPKSAGPLLSVWELRVEGRGPGINGSETKQPPIAKGKGRATAEDQNNTRNTHTWAWRARGCRGKAHTKAATDAKERRRKGCSAVPSGLGDFGTRVPKAKALGYCRLSLRDR